MNILKTIVSNLLTRLLISIQGPRWAKGATFTVTPLGVYCKKAQPSGDLRYRAIKAWEKANAERSFIEETARLMQEGVDKLVEENFLLYSKVNENLSKGNH